MNQDIYLERSSPPRSLSTQFSELNWAEQRADAGCPGYLPLRDEEPETKTQPPIQEPL